jgi:hypothetical protein
MDQQPNQKPNLIAELLKKKIEAQKKGKTFGYFGDSKASRFARPGHDNRPAVFGGRNGQGKP